MPRRRYDEAQQAALDALVEAYAEKSRRRMFLREQFEEQLRLALAGLDRSVAEAARKAHEAGVSKTDVGRAMGTSNWGTVQSVLLLGADVAARARAEAERGEAAGRYRRDGERLAVVLDPADWLGIAQVSGAPADEAGLWSGVFDVEALDDGRVFVTPGQENPLFLPDRGFNHPVAYWLTQYPEHMEAARAWWRTHEEKIAA